MFTPVAPSERQTLPKGDPACVTVDVPVQGKPLRLMVDTGIEGILLYRDRVFKRNPKLRLENETQQSRAGGHLLGGKLGVDECSFTLRGRGHPIARLDGSPQLIH